MDKNTGVWTDKGTFVAPFGSDYTGRALPKGTGQASQCPSATVFFADPGDENERLADGK